MGWGWRKVGCATAFGLSCTACDPLIDVAGAFFPAWTLCIFVAIAVTALLRLVLVRTGTERYLGPRVIAYPSVATGIAFACWVVFFRR